VISGDSPEGEPASDPLGNFPPPNRRQGIERSVGKAKRVLDLRGEGGPAKG
jgi:hypothetical protein